MCIFKSKLPHPEEKRDKSKTLENTHIHTVVLQWFADWNVKDNDYFDQVNIIPSLAYSYPAVKVGDFIYIRPEWCNPGVIAHEMAHLVWDNISQFSFITDFITNIGQEKYLKLLLDTVDYAKDNYKKGNFIEVHAELYRYVGQYMPEYMKFYYPRLL